MFVYLKKLNIKLFFLYNKEKFWYRKLTLKTPNLPIWGTWRYVNSQNTAISLKAIHFFDKIKLILYPQVRNSMTQLTLVYNLRQNHTAQYLTKCRQREKRMRNFGWPTEEVEVTNLVRIRCEGVNKPVLTFTKITHLYLMYIMY